MLRTAKSNNAAAEQQHRGTRQGFRPPPMKAQQPKANVNDASLQALIDRTVEQIQCMYAGKKNQRWMIDTTRQIQAATAQFASKIAHIVERAEVPFPQYAELDHGAFLQFIQHLGLSANKLEQSLHCFAEQSEVARRHISDGTRSVLRRYEVQNEALLKAQMQLKKAKEAVEEIMKEGERGVKKQERCRHVLDEREAQVQLNQTMLATVLARSTEQLNPLDTRRKELNQEMMERLEMHFSEFILSLDEALHFLQVDNANMPTEKAERTCGDLQGTLRLILEEDEDNQQQQ